MFAEVLDRGGNRHYLGGVIRVRNAIRLLRIVLRLMLIPEDPECHDDGAHRHATDFLSTLVDGGEIAFHQGVPFQAIDLLCTSPEEIFKSPNILL